MYKLTLTSVERSAIDWIGPRYRHGDELFSVLAQDCVMSVDWDNDCDIDFTIPEYAAWKIKEIVEEDDCSLACFADDLKAKLIRFTQSVV